MTNEEKAKELLGAPIQWTFNYWLDGFSESTQKELREKRNLLIKMAGWKDQQFKEYLEKMQKEFTDDEAGYYVINRIINELFKED